MAIIKAHIERGRAVAVFCRIPGDSETISSVGPAGWYKIENPDRTIGYIGANTFYNDPGNGYGMAPSSLTFDPAIPLCRGTF
jgi:hypothetical protein